MCDRNIGGRVRMLARPQGQGNKKRQLEHRSHQQKVVTLHPFSSPAQGRASKHACEAAFSTRPCASSGLSNTNHILPALCSFFDRNELFSVKEKHAARVEGVTQMEHVPRSSQHLSGLPGYDGPTHRPRTSQGVSVQALDIFCGGGRTPSKQSSKLS